MKLCRRFTIAILCAVFAVAGHAQASLWQDFLDPDTKTVLGFLHVPNDGVSGLGNCNAGNSACTSPDFHFTYSSGGSSWDSDTAPNFDIGWTIDPSNWQLTNLSGFILSESFSPLTLSYVDPTSEGALLAFEIFGDSTAQVLAVPNHVPIPAALPLFATALAGLGWIARRRKLKAV